MKRALIPILLFAGFTAAAQQKDPYVVPIPKYKKTEIIVPNISDSLNKLWQAQLNQLTMPQAKLSHILPNGNKVYLLPQDNMPCIVPDAYQYQMPVMKGNMNGNMPNLSPRTPLIPQDRPKKS